MELDRLEKYKKQFKDLYSEIGSLQSYLSSINRVEKGMPILTVYNISKQLHIREIDAFFLLSLAEKERLIHKKYKVFSEDNDLLGDFDNTSSIPEKIVNSATGKEVDRDHYYVDIVYELEK